MFLKPAYFTREQDGDTVRYKIWQAREYSAAQGWLAVLAVLAALLLLAIAMGHALAAVSGLKKLDGILSFYSIIVVFSVTFWYGFIPWKRKTRDPVEPFHGLSIRNKDTVDIAYNPLFRDSPKGPTNAATPEDQAGQENFTVSLGDIRALAIRSIDTLEHFAPQLAKFPAAHRRFFSTPVFPRPPIDWSVERRKIYMRVKRRFEVDIETADAIYPVAMHLDKHTARKLVPAIIADLGMKPARQYSPLKEVQYYLPKP